MKKMRRSDNMQNNCNCGICDHIEDCPNDGDWENCEENQKLEELE